MQQDVGFCDIADVAGVRHTRGGVHSDVRFYAKVPPVALFSGVDPGLRALPWWSFLVAVGGAITLASAAVPIFSRQPRWVTN